ncbi:hypothetical protein ACJX0J_004075 [Zea mays]
MAIGMILTPIYLLSMLRQITLSLICIFLPVIGIGIYPDLVLSLSVDRVEKKVKNAEFVPFQFKNQVLYEEYTEYELHNDKLILSSSLEVHHYYNEMHFNESLYTLINMIVPVEVSTFYNRILNKIVLWKNNPHEIKRSSEVSLEFNQSITKQESSFILTKRNTKMIRKKIHNSSIFYFLIFFFNTSMLGLVTSSNLIQIYFFWELVGMCSYLLIGFCACQKAFEF